MSLFTISLLVLATPLLAADTSGCGKQHDSNGASGKYFAHDDGNHQIDINGVTRQYGVWVPPNYNSDTQKQRKLIFDYHGNTGTSEQQHDNSRYQDYDNSYLVVYPQGNGNCWQSAPYCKGSDHDDLTFTTQLLDKMRKNYCIDSNHVYASGKSNGGGFVDFLACNSNGDEFAAFATASAALYNETSLHPGNGGSLCTKKRTIIAAHGTHDCTIPYLGSGNCPSDCPKLTDCNAKQLPNIDTWFGWWGQRDGCAASTQPSSGPSADGYELKSYSCGGKTDVVQRYKVAGLGHCWPADNGKNTDYASGKDCASMKLAYTPKVLEFFGKWSLSSSPKVRMGLEWDA